MAPNRRSDVAELGLKALLTAAGANLMSAAAIAGLFFSLIREPGMHSDAR